MVVGLVRFRALALLSTAILPLNAPVLASRAGGSSPASDAIPASADSALPSGDSAAFRKRMMVQTEVPAIKSSQVDWADAKSSPRLLRISSPFGWRSDPIKGMRRRHSGIDLPGRAGANVYATGAGRIASAGWASGYGNLVEIEHDGGVRTRYGHLSRIVVRRDAVVEQGQLVGKIGSTGRSTGPHLHYEVRLRGMAANPLDFMGQLEPSFETVVSPRAIVVPRWRGWPKESRDGLPESVIL